MADVKISSLTETANLEDAYLPVALSGANYKINLGQQIRNHLLNACNMAKALAGYQRLLNTFADGYKASDGVNSGSSTNYTVNTTSGYVGPTSSASNTRALSFASASSQYLSRSWGSGGASRRLMTLSLFYKRATTGASMNFFAGGENTGNNDFIVAIDATNHISVSSLSGGSFNLQKISTATFTDTASFHHIVVAVDSTQATAANRVRVYHDGTEITSWGTNTIWAQNTDSPINGYNATYTIGRLNYSAVGYFNGILDEVIFIDGQQLTPADFASSNLPIPYAGTYGTKGFSLRFENTGSLGTDSSGNSLTWTLNASPTTTTDAPLTTGTPDNMTLVTTAQTADATVSNGRVLLEIDPISSITLNTDLTAEVTADGAHWAAATLSSVGKGQAGRTVVETADTSVGANTGTSFAARIKTLNNKNVAIYKSAIVVH